MTSSPPHDFRPPDDPPKASAAPRRSAWLALTIPVGVLIVVLVLTFRPSGGAPRGSVAIAHGTHATVTYSDASRDDVPRSPVPRIPALPGGAFPHGPRHMAPMDHRRTDPLRGTVGAPLGDTLNAPVPPPEPSPPAVGIPQRH